MGFFCNVCCFIFVAVHILHCIAWLSFCQARGIAEIINSGIQPLQNLATLKKVADVTGVDSKKADWAKHFIVQGFQGLSFALLTLNTYFLFILFSTVY